ncbi:MAG: T9SS type A sorting domain-containing protein [Bacteroidetes bacterium]|nr:T9SS type A sorting domain-containing protein [Bacteroidota bacterium]
MKHFFTFLFSSLLFAGNLFSQLQVMVESNADTLAAKLAGNGISVSNAIINCPAGASGTFNGSNSNIGIGSGVLLTTGSVINAVGPNLQSSISTANGITFNDPDLMTIEPLATNDVCILEFDAIADCDTMFIKFVFGSDEYPEFVGSGFNDAYGIFVTGPNPSGPAYSGYNMTMIPSTTTPVSINNVNNGTLCPTSGPCTNCSYYIDNCTIDSNSTVEYDGFTQLIFKSLPVIPSQSYHYKYAIADAGDQIYDSGVFFSLNSFACIPNSVNAVSEQFHQVNISPNPFTASAVFSINNLKEQSKPFSLSLVDMFGREVRKATIEMNADEFTFYRNGLHAGIYFYRLENDTQIISSGKLIIE